MSDKIPRPVFLAVFLALLVCLFILPSNLYAIDNIAVNDLSGQGVDQSSASIISDRIRTELFKTGTFKVLERQTMQDILKEQGFQQSGACTDEACLVQMGQLLGVARIVTGTIGKLGQLYTINIRMIDVATGEIVYSESVDCKCAIEDGELL